MKSFLLATIDDLKRLVTKKGVRRLLSTLARWCIVGASRVAAFVRDEAGKIVRAPLRSLGRLGAPLLIVGSAYIFLYNVFSNDIFIDDAEIQGAAKERGFTGEILTQAAIAMMPSVAASRLDALPDFDAKFLQLIERRSSRHDSELVCNDRFPILPPDYSFYLAALPRAEMSSRTPDQVVSSQSLSIKKLAYWARERFGLNTARQLKPVLYADGDQFIVKVVPVPLDAGERKQVLAKLDDAPRVLAGLLLDFLLPELLATETAGAGLSDAAHFVFPLGSAELFLADRQKVLFVSNVFIGTQLERSRTHASRGAAYTQWEAVNRQILAETDYRRYGQLASLLKVGLAERIVMAEIHRKRAAGASQQETAALHRKHLGEYENELSRTVAGRIVLTMLDIRRGDMTAYARRLDDLLKEDVIRTPGRTVPHVDLVSFLAMILLEEGRYEEAGKILASPRWADHGIDRSNTDSAIVFRALRSVVRVAQNDPSEFTALVDGRFGERPCAQYMASSLIDTSSRLGGQDAAALTDLLKTLRRSYEHLERSGLRSFAFYNAWGSLETRVGDPEAAFGKFEKAMRYEGDHEWALLNWGLAALNANRLDVAREKYAKSLEIGTVPMAVLGFMNVLIRQEDAGAYLDAFEKYTDVLGVFDHAYRSDFERFAIIFSCRAGRPLKSTVLRRGELIALQGETIQLDEVRREACAPDNQPK